MPSLHCSRASKKNKVEISFTNWAMGGSLLSLNTSSSLGSRKSLHKKNKHSSDSGFEDAATDDELPAKPTLAPSVSSKKSHPEQQPDEEKPKEVKIVCAECKDNELPPSEKCGPNCPVCNEECTWEKHMHDKYGCMTCKTCGRGKGWLKDEFHKGRGEYACEKCTPDCETCGRGPLWLSKKWKKTLKRKTKIIQGHEDGKKKDGDGKKGNGGDGEESKEKDQGEKGQDGEKGKDGGNEKDGEKGVEGSKDDGAVEINEGSNNPEPDKSAEPTKNAEPKKDGGDNIWTPEQDATIKEMQAEKKSWKVISEKVGSSKQACIDRFKDLQKSGDSVSEKKDEAVAQEDTQTSSGGAIADAALTDVFASGGRDGWGVDTCITITDASSGDTGIRENQNKDSDKPSETAKKNAQHSNQKKQHGGKKKNKGNKQGKDPASTSGNGGDNNKSSVGDGWGGTNVGNSGDQTTAQKNNDGWGAVADTVGNDQPSAQNNDGWGASVDTAGNDKPADQNNNGWGAVDTSWGDAGGDAEEFNASKSTATPTPPAGGYFTDSNPIATYGNSPNGDSAAAVTAGWGGENNSWVNVDTSDLNGGGGRQQATHPHKPSTSWGCGRGNADDWNNVNTSINNNGNRISNISENKKSNSGWAGNTGEWTTVDENTVPVDNSGGNISWKQPDNPDNNGNSLNQNLHDAANEESRNHGAARTWNQGNAFNKSNSFNFNDSPGRKPYYGKLRPTSVWTADDCMKLEHLDRMYQYKWAHIQKGFYDWTGRMISADLIERKFRDDGAA
ncbi:hypothetical protein QTJ16_001631 [Diplocarpon rosae]|uniref:Myb-like domain-containing protein n=1 Tax=Diplocarpon rosae TaxID=946125 RepID=A0AAD9T457_9HELO|nr:hypothetical protein QTJ16_001631 [Diplocarpon rosae]